MAIYLLKFGVPLGSEKHKAQFYLGYCKSGTVPQRVERHRAGQGAAITRAAFARGIDIQLVGSIPGNRKLERKLKNRKSHARLVGLFEGKGL